jgi:MFS family permease
MTIPRHTGFFPGWTMVAISAVGLFLGAFPIVVFAFGVFFESFAREFHASRAAVSLAFTMHNLVSGVGAVLIGRLADRIGPRRVIIPGLVALAATLIAATAIGSSLAQLYVFYIALGVIAPATTTVPYALVVSRWFDRRRGLALGGMMAGLGLGAMLMPMLAQRLIGAVGWRLAFAIVGVAVLVIPVPLVALRLEEAPGPLGLRPDGEPAAGEPRAAVPSLDGVSWRDALRSCAYWRLETVIALHPASLHASLNH